MEGYQYQRKRGLLTLKEKIVLEIAEGIGVVRIEDANSIYSTKVNAEKCLRRLHQMGFIKPTKIHGKFEIIK